MRRWIMLPIILGLLLSMVPTDLLAQSATPVASDSAPTATEVVTEVPANVPEDVVIATPTEESDHPVGQSSAPESNILAANDPPLTINGVAANRIVPFGKNIVVVTDPQALLSMYSDAICEGAETPVDNEYQMVKDSEETVSFQASWPNNPDATPSACLSVTWSVAPTAAPGLTIDGVAANTAVPLVTWIDVETDTGAHLSYYDGADCTNNEREIDQSSSRFSWGTQYTMSFQAEWDYFPNLPKSPCLSATWGNPLPTAPPSLTIDGVAASKSVAVDAWVIVATDPGAGILDYSNGTCAGDGYLQDNPLETSSFIEQTSSFRAVWEDDPSGEGSDCFSVTWEDPGPSVAPSLTIDNETSGKTVFLGTLIMVNTEPGASIWYFTDANCTTDGVHFQGTEMGSVWNIATTYSYKANWTGYPDAPESECLTVTWQNPEPTVAPPLTLDGAAESKTVAIGESVEITTDTYAELYVYFGATNCDGFGPPLNNSQYTDLSDTVTSNSYRSVWTGFPNAPKSDCLTVTWANFPTMTLNGLSGDVSVEADSTITFAPQNGSIIFFYRSLDCSGAPFSQTELTNPMENPAGTVYSVRAVTSVEPRLHGDCYVAKWVASPLLMLNGIESNVTVEIGEEIVFTAESDAHLKLFATLDCSGPATSEVESGFTSAPSEPTAFSVRAASNLDDDFTSECYVATWELPPSIPTETPSPTVVPTETSTPIATPTETQIATPTATAAETSTPETRLITVRVEMWDGSSIEGENWSLYAPVASQAAANPYLSGVLGPKNTALLTDLPYGEYLFVVSPEGIDAQEWAIVITEDSEEIVLQFVQPAMPATPAPEETASVSPTSVAGDPAPTTASVTSLPSTGSGSESTPAILGIAGFLAAAMIAMMIGNRRRAA